MSCALQIKVSYVQTPNRISAHWCLDAPENGSVCIPWVSGWVVIKKACSSAPEFSNRTTLVVVPKLCLINLLETGLVIITFMCESFPISFPQFLQPWVDTRAPSFYMCFPCYHNIDLYHSKVSGYICLKVGNK